MKKFIPILITLILISQANAQTLEGSWKGKLKVMGNELRIVFNVEESEGGYKSTLDSPDQGAYGIAVDSTTLSGDQVFFSIKRIGASYTGKLVNEDSIDGIFSQAGMQFELSLDKGDVVDEVVKRPQDPVEPYPYVSEEVTFDNTEDGVTLSGTLTYPSEGDVFPAVILISGSGPQDRNEELFNHRPFLVLSDHLTKNGIAVLRYDERGVGKSTGDYSKATSNDLARDVEAAIKFLLTRDEIDKDHIGLIGHSEGGIIAPMVAIKNINVNMIVLLAGTGLRGDKLLTLQRETLLEASGIGKERIEKINEFYKPVFQILQEIDDMEIASDSIRNYLKNELAQNPNGQMITRGLETDEYIKSVTDQLVNPWMISFIKYDPAPTLEKVNCPTLVLIGSKDLQVPANPNLSIIEEKLKKGGNNDVVTKELPGLNHLFQTSSTGLPNEYWQIEETLSPLVLDEITNWLKQKTSE